MAPGRGVSGTGRGRSHVSCSRLNQSRRQQGWGVARHHAGREANRVLPPEAHVAQRPRCPLTPLSRPGTLSLHPRDQRRSAREGGVHDRTSALDGTRTARDVWRGQTRFHSWRPRPRTPGPPAPRPPAPSARPTSPAQRPQAPPRSQPRIPSPLTPAPCHGRLTPLYRASSPDLAPRAPQCRGKRGSWPAGLMRIRSPCSATGCSSVCAA